MNFSACDGVVPACSGKDRGLSGTHLEPASARPNLLRSEDECVLIGQEIE